MCAGSVGKAVYGLVCGELWKRWRGGRGIKADRKERIEAIGLPTGETCKERRNGGKGKRREKGEEGSRVAKERRWETGLGGGGLCSGLRGIGWVVVMERD